MSQSINKIILIVWVLIAVNRPHNSENSTAQTWTHRTPRMPTVRI
jgi:hypothetical protein